MIYKRYNTMAEQVNENQQNIKTLADAVDTIIESELEKVKYVDLSSYESGSTISDEDFAKLQDDSMLIKYKVSTGYNAKVGVGYYTFNYSDGDYRRYVCASSDTDSDNDNAFPTVAYNEVSINLISKRLVYTNSKVVVTTKESYDYLRNLVNGKMTIVDLSNYNEGDTISQDDYNLLLNDNAYAVYKQSDDATNMKVLYNRREITSTKINLYGSVVMTSVLKDIDIRYYSITINKSTKVISFGLLRYDNKPATIVNLTPYLQGDLIATNELEALKHADTIAIYYSTEEEQPGIYALCTCYYSRSENRIYVRGSSATAEEGLVYEVEMYIDTNTREITHTHWFVKPIPYEPQRLEVVPTYNADEDQYVLDLSIYHNHDILIRGGWNTLDKATSINFGYCRDFSGVGKGVIMSPITYTDINSDSQLILGSDNSSYTIASSYGRYNNNNLLINCRNNYCALIAYNEV